LDAGAGPTWAYQEAAGGPFYTRSEGLGVASYQAFAAGLFSSDNAKPLRVDGAGLCALTRRDLEAVFQVSPDNPLVGLDGRVKLLHRLGAALLAQPHIFGPDGRPGCLFDALTFDTLDQTRSTAVQAHAILVLLLDTLSGIWPSGHTLGDKPLGDCWPHPAVTGPEGSEGWMPFHKLSQWLTYSLLEPFEWAGVTVGGLDALTGLPEYRNGGLLIDAGVLRLKNPAEAENPLQAGDELIVEWCALTVALLDELAPLVRAQLGLTETQMPLACVLEGGTWAAGRALAQRLRGGTPPLNIASDGTVF
ncbi:MAG: URC4/urg3 family protein, partial [Gammaproteobacteria bacterium]|nr:URC4/urg3 family protein [Gammaproteobacteria bacterium]